MSENKCLFHIPYKLEPDKRPSAPQIRPIKILKAFRDQGFDVTEISGTSKERKATIEDVVRNLDNGIKYSFLYSECSTIPTLLTDEDHLPRGGFSDYRLFRECRRRGVPTGLFYRDIYWLFPEFTSQYGCLRAAFMKALYRFDLREYSKSIDILYVPSEEFGEYAKKAIERELPPLSPLPPACDLSATRSRAGGVDDGILNVLYVGGISGAGMYDMRELFSAVQSLPFVRLTVCVRKTEWELVKPVYEMYLSSNITIAHRSGLDLLPLYKKADLGTLLFHPNEYRTFAMPFKLFEYLGMCLPMLASKDTSVGELIASKGWGWCCGFHSSEIRKILLTLHKNKKMISSASDCCMKDRECNTWSARVLQVSGQLGAVRDN